MTYENECGANIHYYDVIVFDIVAHITQSKLEFWDTILKRIRFRNKLR